jgi:ribose/xylose/arabinose/galactoside ABC-type transport system permease subunit
MSTGTTGGALATPPRGTSTAPPDRPPASRRLVSALAVDKIGAVYVWLAIIVVFTIWAPDTFPTLDTAKQILNTNAITGLAALSILIPLSARVFELSLA